jgi:hypothetical protein
VLVKGETIKQRLTAVTDHVGRMQQQPPDWVFAPWNDAAAGDTWLKEAAKQVSTNVSVNSTALFQSASSLVIVHAIPT